jgi:predicted nucleotidyltransferase
MDEDKLTDVLETVKASLASLYGNRMLVIILYGSYARGDQHIGSDIDLAIVLQGPIDKYLEVERIVDATYEISLENDIMISILPVTESEYKSSSYQIFNNIRREGVVV